MRAREPGQAGYVERDGVKVAYEVFGEGDTAIVFPTVDTIVDARLWKAQVPYLSRHFRVVTLDPRGNGSSDRPLAPAAYDDEVLVGDTIAVMDELGIERAVLAAVCFGAWIALVTAARHPERVMGVVAINPYAVDNTPPLSFRAEAVAKFDEMFASYDGWSKFNRHYWLTHFPDFSEFFFDQICNDPHSTKLW